jgi:uncharacterized protein
MQPITGAIPPRYSDRPFPAYRFIPGKTPHPTRDPDGHSYNKQPEQLDSFNADQWLCCDEYLYGIDLFNYGYWWEAHEALEAVWVAAGRQTECGLFLQGLIQVAVAHLKKFQGFDDVARRMAAEGLEKMNRINGIYLGIDIASFHSAVRLYFSSDNQTPVTIELVTSD